MIGAILFDVDGTLVDSNDLHAAAWREAFGRFGFDIPFETVRAQIGKGGDNLIPSLLGPDLCEHRRREIEDFRSELFRHEYLPRATPFPAIRPLFARLRGDGIKIILATSAKQEELRFHQSLIGSADLVSAATSKDDVDHSKPCPDIFEVAFARSGLRTRPEALVVGDSPWDMKAAGRAGLRALALLCGGFAESDLRAAGAAAVHRDPAALLALYPEWLDA